MPYHTILGFADPPTVHFKWKGSAITPPCQSSTFNRHDSGQIKKGLGLTNRLGLHSTISVSTDTVFPGQLLKKNGDGKSILKCTSKQYGASYESMSKLLEIFMDDLYQFTQGGVSLVSEPQVFAIALFISSVISSIWIADNAIHNLDTSFPIFTVQFTLLASLAVLCGVAFAAPYNARSGRPVDDAVNHAGSVCQVAGALTAGDLSGALQDAGNVNDVENAIAGVISLIGSPELVSILKRDAELSRLV
ncbi:hypothetical protein BDR06DRAFT_1006451 [Suillus hirtellus]|nr:hypothetical protein BDR06DRAFT_1006451 [Suillus hirtellus]